MRHFPGPDRAGTPAFLQAAHEIVVAPEDGARLLNVAQRTVRELRHRTRELSDLLVREEVDLATGRLAARHAPCDLRAIMIGSRPGSHWRRKDDSMDWTVVTQTISLDGVVKAPSGVESVGWTAAFRRDHVGDGCASQSCGEAGDGSCWKDD